MSKKVKFVPENTPNGYRIKIKGFLFWKYWTRTVGSNAGYFVDYIEYYDEIDDFIDDYLLFSKYKQVTFVEYPEVIIRTLLHKDYKV